MHCQCKEVSKNIPCWKDYLGAGSCVTKYENDGMFGFRTDLQPVYYHEHCLYKSMYLFCFTIIQITETFRLKRLLHIFICFDNKMLTCAVKKTQGTCQ